MIQNAHNSTKTMIIVEMVDGSIELRRVEMFHDYKATIHDHRRHRQNPRQARPGQLASLSQVGQADTGARGRVRRVDRGALMSTIFKAALDYAGRGWEVFPVPPGTKADITATSPVCSKRRCELGARPATASTYAMTLGAGPKRISASLAVPTQRPLGARRGHTARSRRGRHRHR